MIRALFFSLLCGILAASFFLIYVMKSVERTKEEERKKEERRLAEERRKAVYEEARRIKEEMDAKKAEAREKAKERMAQKNRGIPIADGWGDDLEPVSASEMPVELTQGAAESA